MPQPATRRRSRAADRREEWSRSARSRVSSPSAPPPTRLRTQRRSVVQRRHGCRDRRGDVQRDRPLRLRPARGHRDRRARARRGAVDDLTHTLYVANNANGDFAGTVSVINTATCNGADMAGCAGHMPTVPVGGVSARRGDRHQHQPDLHHQLLQRIGLGHRRNYLQRRGRQRLRPTSPPTSCRLAAERARRERRHQHRVRADPAADPARRRSSEGHPETRNLLRARRAEGVIQTGVRTVEAGRPGYRADTEAGLPSQSGRASYSPRAGKKTRSSTGLFVAQLHR